MKNVKLKVLFLGVTVVALIGSTAIASDPQPREQDVLAAQVSVTRDAIQSVLEKLRNDAVDQEFSNPDYLAKSRLLSQEVEKAMETFEHLMREKILKQASFWVNRINSVADSSQYSQEEKEALISTLKPQAETIFADLTLKYRAALADLYNVVLPRIESEYLGEVERRSGFLGRNKRSYDSFRFEFADIGMQRDLVTYECGGFTCFESGAEFLKGGIPRSSAFISSVLLSPDLFPRERSAFYNKTVESGCYSSSCQALYSNQLISVLALVKSSLDRRIEFVYRNGAKREKDYFDRWRNEGQLHLEPLDADIRAAKKWVALDQSYSAGLPFDVTENQYRVNMTSDILRKLTEGSRFKGCPTDISALASLLCSSNGGCMSTQEEAQVRRAIEAAKIKDKKERIECLEQALDQGRMS